MSFFIPFLNCADCSAWGDYKQNRLPHTSTFIIFFAYTFIRQKRAPSIAPLYINRTSLNPETRAPLGLYPDSP